MFYSFEQNARLDVILKTCWNRRKWTVICIQKQNLKPSTHLCRIMQIRCPCLFECGFPAASYPQYHDTINMYLRVKW